MCPNPLSAATVRGLARNSTASDRMQLGHAIQVCITTLANISVTLLRKHQASKWFESVFERMQYSKYSSTENT